MRRIIEMSLILLLLLTSLTVGSAKGDAPDQKEMLISLWIPPLYWIEVDTGEILFAAEEFLTVPTQANDQLTIEKRNVQNIITASNAPYRVWISTDEAYLTSPTGKVAVEHLQWSLDGLNWTALSITPQLLLQRETRGIAEVTLNLRLKLNPYEISPGMYSGEIVYTITSL